jgi:hypothetical protein
MRLQALDIDFASLPARRPAPWPARLQPLVVPVLTAAALGVVWWLLRE